MLKSPIFNSLISFMPITSYRRRAVFSPNLVNNQKFWDYIQQHNNHKAIIDFLERCFYLKEENGFLFTYVYPVPQEVIQGLMDENHITEEELQSIIKDITYNPKGEKVLLSYIHSTFDFSDNDEYPEEEMTVKRFNFRGQKFVGNNPYAYSVVSGFIGFGLGWIICASFQIHLIPALLLALAGTASLVLAGLTPQTFAYI
jgi:hypothetical protein